MTAYIGPDRRTGEEDRRKSTYADSLFFMHAKGIAEDRRPVPEIERRQQPPAGVIGGMDAEDMATLADLWRSYEQGRVMTS